MTPELWALLPLATAAGLDLYLTLFFLGAAPHLGWDVSPPGQLAGLHSAPVLVLAALFYVLEALAERWPPTALFWDAVHGVVRPVTAGLLVLLLLDAHPPTVQAAAVLLAMAVAAGVHAVRVGGSLVLWLTRARARTRILAAAVEDAMVLGLCALALDRPVAGAALALILLLGAVPQARPYLDGFRFSLRATWGRTLGALSRGRWFEPEAIPGWAQRGLREDARVPGGPLRGSPAAASGLVEGPPFVYGWLVVTGHAPLFVHRSWKGARVLSLDSVSVSGLDETFLQRSVGVVREDGVGGRLHFPPDGPTPDRLRAEFDIGA